MFDSMQPVAPRPFQIVLGSCVAVRPILDYVSGKPLVTFRAGQKIYVAGDKSGPVYRVVYGMVRIYRILMGGRRQICAFHLPGDVFGLEAEDEHQFFADAISKTGLQVLRLSVGDDLSQFPTIALRLLNQAQNHLLALGRQDALGRMQCFLVEMAERQQSSGDGVLMLPMTRTDMGDYLGLTLETVSRVLTKLKKGGVIRQVTPHRMDILRWDVLLAGTA